MFLVTRQSIYLNKQLYTRSHYPLHLSSFKTRLMEAGFCTRLFPTRVGRCTKPPPQLGQTPFNTSATHDRQNVHSKEQIIASSESAGKSTSQHSHPGLISSINYSPEVGCLNIFRSVAHPPNLNLNNKLKPLINPPRHPANHLLNRSPEFGEIQRRLIRPITMRPRTINHKKRVFRIFTHTTHTYLLMR